MVVSVQVWPKRVDAYAFIKHRLVSTEPVEFRDDVSERRPFLWWYCNTRQPLAEAMTTSTGAYVCRFDTTVNTLGGMLVVAETVWCSRNAPTYEVDPQVITAIEQGYRLRGTVPVVIVWLRISCRLAVSEQIADSLKADGDAATLLQSACSSRHCHPRGFLPSQGIHSCHIWLRIPASCRPPYRWTEHHGPLSFPRDERAMFRLPSQGRCRPETSSLASPTLSPCA